MKKIDSKLMEKRSMSKKAYKNRLKAYRLSFEGFRPSVMKDKRRGKRAEQRMKKEWIPDL